MIDIKILRENPQLVKKSSSDKGFEINVKHILELDKKARDLDASVQKLREDRNKLAKEKNIEKGKDLKVKLGKEENALNAVSEELKSELLKIPNLPAKDIRVGSDEKANKFLYKKGAVSTHMFKVLDHLSLGEKLKIIDVKHAAKVSGARFAYLINEAVVLEFALVQYAMELLSKEGFIPIIPPVLINKESTKGLGYWNAPKNIDDLTGNEEYYVVLEPKNKERYFYLVGTAEHSIVPFHSDEILNKKELPKRYVGFSTSFRREAGSYGKDTKGIFRVHQFDKVEMVSLVTEEEDDKELKYLLSLQEKLFQSLEIPYQVIEMCTGDLGFPAAKKYDLEAWIPSEGRYREVTSVSTTTDFQARRLNIKYQDGTEKKFVHILNGTAFAIGRTLIAILENNQNEDGSINIPEVLHKYLNFRKIG